MDSVPLTNKWDAEPEWFWRLSCKQEIGVRLPAVPLTMRKNVGSWSRRYDAGMAYRQPGFDSRRVHSVGRRAATVGRGYEQ